MPASLISLTYDDGMDQHLDHAMPDLEAAGLRGTFYVDTGRGADSPWLVRQQEWAAGARRGHELGNHTRFHPCRGKPEKPGKLEGYTLAQIEAEIVESGRELDACSPATARSFAYTCCHTEVGPDDRRQSFKHITARLFPASRGGADKVAVPGGFEFDDVPSVVMNESVPLERVSTALDQAERAGGWTVLMFHGVGGGWINVTRDQHQAIVSEVARRVRGGNATCMTFVDAALEMRRRLGQPWTAARA